jgi:hypothetical protein
MSAPRHLFLRTNAWDASRMDSRAPSKFDRFSPESSQAGIATKGFCATGRKASDAGVASLAPVGRLPGLPVIHEFGEAKLHRAIGRIDGGNNGLTLHISVVKI